MNNNQTLMSIVIGVVALIVGILIGTFALGSSSSTNSDDPSFANIKIPGTLDNTPTQIEMIWFSNLTGIVQSITPQEVTIAVESPEAQVGAVQPLVTLPIQFHPQNTSPVNEYRQDNTTGSVEALPSSIGSITPGNRVGLNIKREQTGEVKVEQIILHTVVN